MRREWLIYTVVAAVSIGAGLAIAGGPAVLRSSDGPTSFVTVPSTTSTSVPDAVGGDTTSTVPTPTTPTTTTTTSLDPTPSTTAPDDTAAPAIRPRNGLSVAVANASSTPGIAGELAARLSGVGYADVDAVDAADFPISGVFHLDGLDREARRLAADAGLPEGAIAPMGQAPSLDVADTYELVVVLGTDNDTEESTAEG